MPRRRGSDRTRKLKIYVHLLSKETEPISILIKDEDEAYEENRNPNGIKKI
jgi:hypothetical protein